MKVLALVFAVIAASPVSAGVNKPDISVRHHSSFIHHRSYCNPQCQTNKTNKREQ